MGLQIADGAGSGRLAVVDELGRLHTYAVAEGPLEFAAHEGEAGVWYSTLATGGSNVEVMSIQNKESKKLLHITRFVLSSSAISVFSVIEVTSGTPAGTPLVYTNPNFGSSVANAHTSFGNAAVTGSVVGTTFMGIQVLADNSKEIFVEGAIILGKDDTIALSCDVNATVHVSVFGFWEAA